MGLFEFILGAVTAVGVILIIITNYLSKIEEQVQQKYDEAKQPLEREPPDTQSIRLTDKKTQVRVEPIGSAEVADWSYGLVRNNMVFLFRTDLDTSASGVFCLDGCKVSVVKSNMEQSSPWHKKNPIMIISERVLFQQAKTLMVHCQSAREAEMWYYALFQGANLSIKKDTMADQRAKKEQSYFSFLHTVLKNATHTPAPSPNPTPNSTPSTTPSSTPSPSPSITPHSQHPHLAPPVLARSSSASLLQTPAPSSAAGSSSSGNNNAANPQLNLTDSHLHSHLTWLNALLGRMFWNIHDAPDFSAFMTRKFNKKLLKIKKPSILKALAICNVSFGQNLPMINHAMLDYISPTGEVIVVGDIIYHGGFTLTVNIDISLEVMGHSLAVPVMITARVTHLQGKAVVRIPPPPSVRIWFAFEREPTCEVDIDTAFGAAGKLANIPRLARVIVNALKTEMLKIIVLPNMEDFLLPKFKGQQGDKNVVSTPPQAENNTTNKDGSPSANTNTEHIDKKMIAEALEKLDKNVQPHHL